MKTRKYKVKLSEEERQQLKNIINNGKNSAKKIKRANILCLLDENQEKVWKQREISEICQVSTNTIYYIVKQYAEEGLNTVLKRKQRKTPPVSKITGDIEARIIALSCSEPPKGRSRWTLQLLADKAVELKIIDSISDDTVRKVLKKRT